MQSFPTTQSPQSPPQQQIPGFKVFVGHIPLTMKEDELTEIFDKFGQILNISIIKDKRTNVPKGCAFINYSSKDEADNAINTVNSSNQFIGEMNKPLQVKYSDNEIEKMERKLFIGMLGTIDEDQTKTLFGKYGLIEELTIVRDKDGRSKGYGFIKFSTRDEAEEAIKDLDSKQTLPGSSIPMIVKFADTERQKRKKQQINQIQLTRQQQQQQQQQQIWGNNYYQPNYMDMGQQQQHLGDNGHGYMNQPPRGFPNQRSYPQQQNINQNFGDQYPPHESNDLFIYYLPASYGDNDLKSLFQSFGNVISAKVFIDKNTNQSKCFGFISYDNSASAVAAINSLNGYHVEGKKLKVNFKRERN